MTGAVSAGAVETWKDPALPGRAILVQPAAPSERPAAILFHLPPTGGRPAVDPPLPGIVQVGMPALRADEVPADSDLATETWRACLRVRDRLAAGREVDSNRCLVSGMSRGGWIASAIAMKQPPGLAGVLIFGAGHPPDSRPAARRFPGGFQVYIACGDLDENLPLALGAIRLYRESGASVSFERYPLAGHVRRITPRCRRWLLRVGGGTTEAGFLDDRLRSIAKVEDGWLRARLLEVGLRDPAQEQASHAVWTKALQAAKETPAGREGDVRRRRLQALLGREVALHQAGRTEPDRLRVLADEARAIAESMPGTPEGIEARIAGLRIAAVIKRKQEEARRFGAHPAAARLRELQAELNRTQARIQAAAPRPDPADLQQLKRLATTYAAEAARVKRAGLFTVIPGGTDLGPDPLPEEADRWLTDQNIAPAEALFPLLPTD